MFKEQKETKEPKYLPLSRAFRVGSKTFVRVEENLSLEFKGKVGVIDLNVNGAKAVIVFTQEAFNNFTEGEPIQIPTIQSQLKTPTNGFSI
jgi:hypothetical protein